MRTITFYSYKGGTGRTLLLANVASFLTRFCNQRVVALDLDLEAPGLPYKFGVQPRRKGIVDYIAGDAGRTPVSEFCLPLEGNPNLLLAPAGRTPPDRRYAEQLGRLDWAALWEPAPGREASKIVEALRDFKTACRDELNADYLLIDSRTGITDVGALALGLLADDVVCLMVNNQENRDGIRRVLSTAGVVDCASRVDASSAVKYTLIVSRIDEDRRLYSARRGQIVEETLEFLNRGEVDSLAAPHDKAGGGVRRGLTRDDVLVVHSDRELELGEMLLFDSARSFNETPLVRDYYSVFEHLGLIGQVPDDQLNRAAWLRDNVVAPRTCNQLERAQVEDRVARGRILEYAGDTVRATVVHRVRARTPNTLISLPSKFHVRPKLRTLMAAVRGALCSLLSEGLSVQVEEASVEDPDAAATPAGHDRDVIWSHLIATRLLEGAYDVCDDPYYLTWLRSHLVEIVQLGWVERYVVLVPKELLPDPRRTRTLDRLVEQILGSVRVPLNVLIVGETAAASECVRVLGSQVPRVQFRGVGAADVAAALEAAGRRAIAVCDTVIARKAQIAGIEQLEVAYEKAVPVGIAYPRTDRVWRGYLSRALLKVLDDEQFADLHSDLKTELEAEGVTLLASEHLRDRLLLDLAPKDMWERIRP